MRILPTLLALTIAALSLGSADVASALPQTTSATEPGAPGLSVDITPRQDGTIVAGADLTVAVRLSNDSDAEVAAGTATVYLARTPVADRAELDAWLLADGVADAAEPAESADLPDYRGTEVLRLPTPSMLPGASVVLTDAVVPAAALPFVADTAGVYLLSVVASAGDLKPAVSRSAVTVRNAAVAPAARLALAMPITLPPAERGVISADDLATYTATGGLLDRQLTEVFAQPVAVGIDPRIIASIRLLGDSAPASAIDWLERLRSIPNDTFALAYADTDIAATSQAGAVVLAPTNFAIDDSLFNAGSDGNDGNNGNDGQGASSGPTPPTDPVVPTLDDLLAWDYSLSGIAWPRDGSVIGADLQTFAASGLRTTIVSSANRTAAGAAAAPASGAVAGHRVVTSDDTLSRLLREAVAAPTLAQWQADVARLSAALAGVSAETASGGAAAGDRIVLATLGRDLPTAEFRLAATIAATTGSGLAAPASFADAITQSPAEVAIVDSPVAAERVAQISGMFASEGAVAQFATVLEDPRQITGERRLSLMALASQSWTTAAAAAVDAAAAAGSNAAPDTNPSPDTDPSPDTGVSPDPDSSAGTDVASSDPGNEAASTAGATDWPAAVAGYLGRSSDILSSVVVASTNLVQTSDRNPLPIVVTNALDYPVTVTVEVVALRPIVSIEDSSVELTVPANSQKRASIAAESIANGEVNLSISLYSKTRVLISAPSLIEVTVNAGWETTATSVLGVIVFAVFIMGIIRTIRRRRRIARGEQDDGRTSDVRDENEPAAR